MARVTGCEAVLAEIGSYCAGCCAARSARPFELACPLVLACHSASIRPSSVEGGAPLRYSASKLLQLFVASKRPSRALTPHTTRSRMTYDGGMFSRLMTSPYLP